MTHTTMAELLVSMREKGPLWRGYWQESERMLTEQEAEEPGQGFQSRDAKDVLALARAYVYSARQVLQHQKFEAWQTYMDEAEAALAELDRRHIDREAEDGENIPD
jgi:hypothetical protein